MEQGFDVQIKGDLQTIFWFFYLKVSQWEHSLRMYNHQEENYNVFKIHNKLHWTRMMTLQLLIKMHALAAQGSEQKRHAYILHRWTCLASGIVMEIHCHITDICEPPMSSSLFSIICLWFSKVLLFLFITTINSPNLYAMWLIYVPPKVKL